MKPIQNSVPKNNKPTSMDRRVRHSLHPHLHLCPGLSLSLLLAALWAPQVFAAETRIPSTKDVTGLLESSAVLAPGEKVTVSVKLPEVSVNAFVNLSAREIDNDCKIDAVLLARKIFEKYSGVVTRVKLNFYERKNRTFVRIINVTAGDVSSFATGATSMAQLLSSLEVRKESVRTPAPLPGNTSQPATAPSTLSNTGTTKDLIAYTESATGLQLGYPHGWVRADRPDKDTLCSFSFSDEPNGRSGFFLLSASPRFGSARLEQHVQLMSDHYIKHIPGCLLHSTAAVLIGARQTIPAVCQSLTFTMNNTRMRSEFYYFFDGDKLILLRCASPDSCFNSVKPLFNSMLLSISTPSHAAAGTTRTSNGTPVSAPSLLTYKSPSGRFSFAYPAKWEVKPYPEKDVEVKISGYGSGSHSGELSLRVSEEHNPAMIEIHANNLEEMMRNSLKSCTRVSRTHVNAGGSDVFYDTYSFVLNNWLVVQHIAYIHSEGKLFCLILFAPGWSKVDSSRFFEQTLKTVRLGLPAELPAQ